MDPRAPPPRGAPTQHRRPPLSHSSSPLRTVSTGSYGSIPTVDQQTMSRKRLLPEHMTHARSVSQPMVWQQPRETAVRGAARHERSSSAVILGNEEGPKVYSSPDVVEVDDADGLEEPPSKRVKTTSELESKTEESNLDKEGDWSSGDESSMAHDVLPGSPLPIIRKIKPLLSNRFAAQRKQRSEAETARRATGVNPPAIATRVPPPKRVLDFSPWTGNHQEDVLNEGAIKAGFFDKTHGASSAETSSAKAAIWPNLSTKNHTGLQMLSYLYTQVLEKRQVVGRCTAPSTFKPPPRVTVTDTKREAWLRDLANANVPLRKQSRTIPHGIRGRVLLEQCLGKTVPLHRAVWLAKCVGANELRAYRRKGVSGVAIANETKWVRDWTVNVENFLETIAATVGQADWQANMQYCIRLASALYAEQLLEIDHYLDWVLSSFAKASFETLPLWILIVQIYWKDLTKFGRRARTLAQTTLAHLEQIEQAKLPGYRVLVARLQKLVTVLAFMNRGCLIIPRTWRQYSALIHASLIEHGKHRLAAHLAGRNERLAEPLHKTPSTTRSAVLDLYTALDAFNLNVDVNKLSAQCTALIPKTSELVRALFEWASTPYRIGNTRIYLAARLVSHLQRNGVDTDGDILNYIGDIKSADAKVWKNIQLVIVELVRLDAFSVGRYLQWLISTGLLSGSTESNCATSILSAIPTENLPIRVYNTRKTLMIRLGQYVDETKTIDDFFSRIEDTTSTSPSAQSTKLEVPDTLTMSARFTAAQKLTGSFSSLSHDGVPSLRAFCVVRNVLQTFQDFASLAALIRMASQTNDSALLATVVDTINLNADVFAAMQDLAGLVQLVMDRYSTVRTQQTLDRVLIRSLCDLVHRIPDKRTFAKVLAHDIAVCEQQISMAACSPASDSLITMHASSLESDDEIKAVFASGNTMDEHLMQRVFIRIMQRASKAHAPDSGPMSKEGVWLNQLRSVDSSGFDQLVHKSLRTFISGSSETVITTANIASLVASGCLSLATFADIAKDTTSPHVSASALGLFTALESPNPGLHDPEWFRYRVQQELCWTDRPNTLVTILRTAFETNEGIALDDGLVGVMVRCITMRPGSVRTIFEEGSNPATLQTNSSRLVTAILERAETATQRGSPLDAASVMRMANPLSVRFCTGLVRYLKTTTALSPEQEKDLGDAVMDSFMQHSEVWPQLLEFAGHEANRRIHTWAQEQVLSMVSNSSETTSEHGPEQVNRCLDVLALSRSVAQVDEEQLAISGVTTAAKDIDKQLFEAGCGGLGGNGRMATLVSHVGILLRLAGLHIVPPGSDSEACRLGRSGLLSALCNLIVHPRLQLHPATIEYLFDVASALSDSLPEETLELVKRPDTASADHDLRMASILGSPNTTTLSTDSWLAIASRVPPPGTVLGTTQQQRALNRHPSSHASAPSLSRQPSNSSPGAQSPTLGPQAQSPVPQQRLRPSSFNPPTFSRPGDNRGTPMLSNPPHAATSVEWKLSAFPLRKWEVMSDPSPIMGENDASLSLTLFGARRV